MTPKTSSFVRPLAECTTEELLAGVANVRDRDDLRALDAELARRQLKPIPVYVGTARVGTVFPTAGGFFRAGCASGATTVGAFGSRDAAERWVREESYCFDARGKRTAQVNPLNYLWNGGGK